MNLYCSVCGKTQDSQLGKNHTHFDAFGRPYLIQLSVVVTYERKTYGGRSSYNRRIKTAKDATETVEEEAGS